MMHNSGSKKEKNGGKKAKSTYQGTTHEDIDVDSLEYRLAEPMRSKRQWATFTRLMGALMIILGLIDLLRPTIYFLEGIYARDNPDLQIYDHYFGGSELSVVFSLVIV